MSLTEAAKTLQPHLESLWQEFHAHPEVSEQEEQTSARILAELQTIGSYEIRPNVSGHGILAELKGEKPGPWIALRADMDALQITEESGLACASQNSGVMHACGHDAHTTMLLGAARLLAERRSQLAGGVRLIFQPAEELSPKGGSRGMMEAGALEGVESVYGLHVWPELPVGSVGLKAGPLMAASDHFSIHIVGKPSHGAQPHEGVDALMAGVQFASAVQTIVSRNANPQEAIVVTLGCFHAGTRYNIVPGSCEIEGTCRTFDANMRDMAERRLNEVLQGVCNAMGCTGTLDYERGYCATVNDPEQVEVVRKAVAELFGAEHAVTIQTPSMCSEDFAFYLTEKSGAFVWMGAGTPGAPVWPLHNCHFVPNADVLWRGSALLARLALGEQNS